MRKIVIGSLNPDKIGILQKVLREINFKMEVIGVKADSQVSSQPLDKDSTRKRAINRAHNARAAFPEADFWIGLEGGLHNYQKGYFLVSFACLLDKKGKQYIGEGEKIRLPKTVSQKIKQGEWFGKVIREYAQEHNLNQNLITREKPFSQAIKEAFKKYQNSPSSVLPLK